MRHYFVNTWEYFPTWLYVHTKCLVDSKIITEIKTDNWNRNDPI